jgi:4-hydroxy-tetrahydrodipicolinate synthase|tara:strand:+ start:2016 stop:2903 length:888 start_codon:yes stop_codon:yes gene_type:complete
MTNLQNGIYSASLSVLNDDLSLNDEQTVLHAEKLISQGCAGAILAGTTGMSAYLSIREKMNLIERASKSSKNQSMIIGPGTNSLLDTVKLINFAKSKGLSKFLCQPCSYGWPSIKNKNEAIYSYFSELVKRIGSCEIILYNFPKLAGVDFSVEIVEKLVKNYKDIFVGLKDSGSDDLYKKIKIENFKVFVGSEKRLLSSLKEGCSGLISATIQFPEQIFLAKKVFEEGKDSEHNEQLVKVRSVFDSFNLIEGLHTLYAQKNPIYKNILPPLRLLNEKDKTILFGELEKLNFNIAA